MLAISVCLQLRLVHNSMRGENFVLVLEPTRTKCCNLFSPNMFEDTSPCVGLAKLSSHGSKKYCVIGQTFEVGVDMMGDVETQVPHPVSDNAWSMKCPKKKKKRFSCSVEQEQSYRFS